MSGKVFSYDRGPIVQEVVEQVTGGQLVEARAAGKVGVAGAGSLVVLGVAQQDALPASTNQDTTDAFGETVVNLNIIGSRVDVDRGKYYTLKYAANASFGQKVIAAALGQVTPAGATPDARTIVGVCWEPAGVVSGALGLTYIN